MNLYDPRYVHIICHMQDLEHEAAAARLAALAAPRRPLWALIRSTVSRLRPMPNRVLQIQPQGGAGPARRGK
jgi:hypothetical protein